MKKTILLTIGFLFGAVTPVYAHAFGQQYILPIPVSFYLYGSAVALVASFIIIGIFKKEQNGKDIKQFTLRFHKNSLQPLTEYTVILLKIISILFLLVTIVSGLFGTTEPI